MCAGQRIKAFVLAHIEYKVWWEALEWGSQDMGTTGLQLTYDDTIGDLVLSTSGGVLGAAIAARLRSRRT